MNGESVIVWFRDDLRLADHPALTAAVQSGLPVLPVYLWSPAEEYPWEPGAASRWWLHQSLRSLEVSLGKLGLRLILRRGPSLEALRALAAEVRAKAVFWNRRYEPAIVERDKAVKASLRASGIEAQSFPGNLLREPWTIRNTAGQPFRVFTAFWKACRIGPPTQEPLPPPKFARAPMQWPASAALRDLALEPQIDWAAGLRETWRPGETAAVEQMDRFLESGLRTYGHARDIPAETGTSGLSPYLHFGEISPRQVWHRAARIASETEAAPYLRQLIWREFAYHMLFHFPATPSEPFNSRFARFPWQYDRTAFRAWSKGLTGYPMVDAGMRQLWHTGWMHNRVRMIAASFFVKHLLIPWQHGARWFWDTLVDADLANNTFGWQWAAGCGADPAPYFRIFNPVLQGERFDPRGHYIRRWIPELSSLPDRWIHCPWKAPKQILKEAGIVLGSTYPAPIVDHQLARERALDAFKSACR